MTGSSNQKPQIQYPCDWGFKVIGMREESVRDAIMECMEGCLEDRRFEVGGSRQSGGGKYVSVSLMVRVESEEERNTLFQALADHEEIRIVI